MRIADAGVLAADGEDPVEFGLPMSDQNHAGFPRFRREPRKLRVLPVGSGSAEGEAAHPRINALAVVPSAPHVVDIQPRPGARYFLYGGRARKGDGRLSAILRHYPVRYGCRFFGAALAQRAWAADRK